MIKTIKQVKLLSNDSRSMLEHEINLFCAKHSVIDIRYQTCMDKYGIVTYSAMIIYIYEKENSNV